MLFSSDVEHDDRVVRFSVLLDSRVGVDVADSIIALRPLDVLVESFRAGPHVLVEYCRIDVLVVLSGEHSLLRCVHATYRAAIRMPNLWVSGSDALYERQLLRMLSIGPPDNVSSSRSRSVDHALVFHSCVNVRVLLVAVLRGRCRIPNIKPCCDYDCRRVQRHGLILHVVVDGIRPAGRRARLTLGARSTANASSRLLQSFLLREDLLDLFERGSALIVRKVLPQDPLALRDLSLHSRLDVLKSDDMFVLILWHWLDALAVKHLLDVQRSFVASAKRLHGRRWSRNSISAGKYALYVRAEVARVYLKGVPFRNGEVL